jgi:HAMP domain-containing protein
VANKSSFADQELSPVALERLLSTLSLARGGDFTVRMVAGGDGTEREVADTVNDLIGMLGDFTKEIERVSEAVGQGDLRARLPLDKANGGWGQQMRAVNNMVVVFGKHVAELRRVTKAVHAGDMSRPVNVGPEATHRGGELARAAEDINAMIAHIAQVTAEITRVFAEVGLDGRLNAQCHISDASGSWGLLVGSVNAASASLSEQVQDLCATAQALAAGNLSARATVTSRGDLQTLKLGLNSAADGLAALCSELRRVATEVVSEGKLASALRHPDPRGEWQSAQDAVNQMLGSITSTWRNLTGHAERVLDGDYTATADARPAGEMGEPARVLEAICDQQRHTQLALAALIEGRFADVRPQGQSQREMSLMQLGLRLKREFFRAMRAVVFEAREQSQDARAFAEAALTPIAHALGAVAGAYYSVIDGMLVPSVILGCDAPTRSTPLRIGEGLMGKVAKDRTPLLLDKLEEYNVRVQSGLFEITPRALLLFPVQKDELVSGVLELVFLNDSASTALEVLEYLMADLARGPSFVNAPASDRLRGLEEELVIANTRLERMSAELQHRERSPRVTVP